MTNENYGGYDEPFDAGDQYVGDLTEYKDPFSESDAEEGSHEPIPDGKYQANVEKAELRRTKNEGKLMLTWALRILGPQHRGRVLWKNAVFSLNSIKWIKKDLYTCDLKLDDITKLPANLHRLLNLKLEITKKTNGDYENIYLNKRLVLDGDDAGSGGEYDSKAKDDFTKF